MIYGLVIKIYGLTYSVLVTKLNFFFLTTTNFFYILF